ncbi:hypothetical protein JCM30237_22950 [Halolamina litorea]|uniref:Glyoxylase, beta-lactamase superfamily II n=1 Tax=Halolamina litorea TaxID=1515593 RepID=A0ABD6BQ59_9EURY|nr:hypothetical protein [Halolamina litorea]
MTTLEVVDRWENGISWTLAEELDGMHRTSHAIDTEEGVWLVDPVDAPGLDDELDELGEVVGVTLLLDRHKRDAAAIATRHEVRIALPTRLSGITDDLDAPVETYSESLSDTGFRTVTVVDNQLWHEVALRDPGTGTLIVPEAVGTADFFLTGDERLGVHPALRLFPPRKALGKLSPDRILVGHGPGVFDDATGALETALSNSRRSAPRYYLGLALTPFK